MGARTAVSRLATRATANGPLAEPAGGVRRVTGQEIFYLTVNGERWSDQSQSTAPVEQSVGRPGINRPVKERTKRVHVAVAGNPPDDRCRMGSRRTLVHQHSRPSPAAPRRMFRWRSSGGDSTFHPRHPFPIPFSGRTYQRTNGPCRTTITHLCLVLCLRTSASFASFAACFRWRSKNAHSLLRPLSQR